MLKKGDKAPDFKGIDQYGNEISLKDLKGKKVILYFYPKDFTPGCTAEACNLAENYEFFKNKGYEIIGISADNEASHKKFSEKYKLPFTLIADPEKKIITSYNVWGKKKFMGKTTEGILRTTFIISEEGIIEEIIDKVDTKNHSQQIINQIKIE